MIPQKLVKICGDPHHLSIHSSVAFCVNAIDVHAEKGLNGPRMAGNSV